LRVRNAVAVLLGRKQTSAQMLAEWVELRADVVDILERQGAMLARIAKREKQLAAARLDEIAAEPVQASREPVATDHKAELRARAAALRGLRPLRELSYEPLPEEANVSPNQGS